jgi:hypothetical protein
MFDLLRLWSGFLHRFLRSRQSLLIENLALRQQLAVFKRQHSRPRLTPSDKIFWVLQHRFWSSWKAVLIVVTPETVVRWHRSGFQLYWLFLSRVRKPVGRRPVTREILGLIFRMVAENPTWRAPRIHGELVMLGFEVSERSVSRWMRRAPRPYEPGQRWLGFLRNHHEAIAAMDFFSVPTLTFNVRYVFFLIGHDRRRILHCNVKRHPTSGWIVQQLREAFPFCAISEMESLVFAILGTVDSVVCPSVASSKKRIRDKQNLQLTFCNAAENAWRVCKRFTSLYSIQPTAGKACSLQTTHQIGHFAGGVPDDPRFVIRDHA